MLGLVHPDQHVVAHHGGHELADGRRGVGHVVPQDGDHVVVAVDDVAHLLEPLDERGGEGGLHRLVPALGDEVRVGVAQVAGDSGELGHGVEGHAVDHGHRS